MHLQICASYTVRQKWNIIEKALWKWYKRLLLWLIKETELFLKQKCASTAKIKQTNDKICLVRIPTFGAVSYTFISSTNANEVVVGERDVNYYLKNPSKYGSFQLIASTSIEIECVYSHDNVWIASASNIFRP